MKKIKYLLIAVSILVSASAFSQNIKSDYEKKILGSWKVDSLDIGSFNLSPEYAEIVKEKLPQIIAMTQVEFGKKKKYHKTGFDGETKGTWSISKDGAFVLIKLDGESKVSKTKIIKLTDDKLIIAPDNEESANSKAYMYKVN